jgi:predicted dehydrogenase
VLRGSAASTEANSKINLAAIGLGGQGTGDMGGMLSTGRVNVVALCDPDARQIDKAAKMVREHGEAEAKRYEDYRRLLEEGSSFDAVLIATPDHWHAPLCKAFMKAGKHVYCEKPLTHSLGEARELRELARTCKVVTQMGNQGSAEPSLRRCIELIKAGALGQVREVYQYGIHSFAREGNAKGEDPIPAGFNWDLWVGPSALRPFKDKVYHPKQWRGWYDFGNGSLMDFFCHDANLPFRALELGYPERIVVNVNPKNPWEQTPGKAAWEYHFAARGALPPVTLYWQGGGKPPAEILQQMTGLDPQSQIRTGGVCIAGDKGCIFTDHWGYGGHIRLKGEASLEDVRTHEATQGIPKSLPRVRGHAQEWFDAIQGKGRTFSDFETGGMLTEIGLAGVLALRVGKNLEWDGEKMEARNAPEAARFVHPELRTKWLA